MKRVILYTIISVMLVISIGCAFEKADDGTITGIGWDPKVKAVGDDVAESAEGVMGILGYVSPVAAGALAAALATWKKMSKTTIKFKRPLEFYVQTLEKLKESSPQTWAAIKTEIKSGKPAAEIEGTVREILDKLHPGEIS